MPTIPQGKRRPWMPKIIPFKGMGKDFNYQSRQWRELSLAKRRSEPLCEDCHDKGIIKASDCVDHIIPIREGGDPWAWGNLRALCRSCHDSKTGRSKSGKKK